MSYTFLQGREAAFSAGCYSDIPLCVRSNWTPTAGKCCSNGNGMDCCQSSQSGMTCEPSTGDRGEESQKSSAVASPAKTSPASAAVKDSAASTQDCGPKCEGSWAKYNPATSSWKTRQCSLLGGLESYSETWPDWGTTRNGESFRRAPSVLHIHGKGCSYWPTPRASNPGSRPKGNGGRVLAEEIAIAEGIKQRGQPGSASGIVNPAWVEWLMGWPIGWTDLRPLETAKYQQWYDWHGGLS